MTEAERSERLRLTRVVEARAARLSKKYDEEFFLDLVDHIFVTLEERSSKAKNSSVEMRLLTELQHNFKEKIYAAGEFIPKSLTKHLQLEVRD